MLLRLCSAEVDVTEAGEKEVGLSSHRDQINERATLIRYLWLGIGLNVFSWYRHTPCIHGKHS
jgi:hypothetical protein